jgi:hypothetical protein
MALPCGELALTKQLQVQLLITDLGPPLRTDMALLQPTSLDEAVKFTHAYEQQHHSSHGPRPGPSPGLA